MKDNIVKTYRSHYCTKTHQGFRTAAKCLWKRATWITGDGAYALVAQCRTRPEKVITISLWKTADEAHEAKGIIDASGCGGACRRNHEIIFLVEPARMASSSRF